MGPPGWLSGKESTCNSEKAGDPTCSISWMGRSLEEGVATHRSICALENPMDKGAWQAAVHRIAQSHIHQKQLTTT